jgi:hypothetical protein
MFDLWLGEEWSLQTTHLVGTYHVVDGRFTGLSVWRTGSGRLGKNSGACLASIVPIQLAAKIPGAR